MFKLRKYEEFELISLCLYNNSHAFDLDYDLISWLRSNEKIISHRLIQKLSAKNELFKELKEIIIEPVDIKVTTEEYIKRIEIVKSKSKRGVEKNLTLYEYYKLLSLHKGDKFGEISLERNFQKR